MWTYGKLQLRADGKIVVRAEPNYTVAVFEPGELTRLIVPGPTGSPSASGRWEVAYVGSNGPRFLAFDAPTMALFPGVLDESCNAFLSQAGLDDKIGLKTNSTAASQRERGQAIRLYAAKRGNRPLIRAGC
jgi:hypothetical protein